MRVGESSQAVTIYCKLYMPNGTLSTGTGSPSGYTYKSEVTLYSGENDVRLLGWGANDTSIYTAGYYRMEFYCNGQLFNTPYFRIY